MMDKPVFNATSFVDINLATGAITSSADDRLALVPKGILKALKPGDDLARAAFQWGKQHGQQLAKHASTGLGMEALASFLSGTIAAFGMGRLRIEIRNNALLFRARGVGDGDVEATLTLGESELLEGFLAGYLSALGEQPFCVIHVGEENGDQLFFAGNPTVVGEVRKLPAQGNDRVAAVEKLIARSH